MGKWCLHASSFIFDLIIIKVAGNQDKHKSLDVFDFGPLVSMAHFMFFEMRIDLGTLDSVERSLPFGLLVIICVLIVILCVLIINLIVLVVIPCVAYILYGSILTKDFAIVRRVTKCSRRSVTSTIEVMSVFLNFFCTGILPSLH